ncbi:ABC transporter permease [Silvibacterium sp.]|uniref:ABC transporter permease n=1 Tax=Silvibacterium sp. TaxID=1964179 RepID=UPI0039E383D2
MAIGGVEQAHQKCRDARGTRLIEDLFHDLRFAVRQLRRSSGFTITAIAVFAFGVAASSTIFAFVDAAFIKPLPYSQPSRLVALFESIPVNDRAHLSFADFQAWKAQNHVFSSLDVYRPDRVSYRNRAAVEEISIASVSDGFFRTLGVSPILGRDFRPGEDLASAPQTVLLSYGAWQRRFAADSNIIGRTVEMDGHAYEVIGVLPSGFHFAPVEPAEFWRTIHGLCVGNRFCYPYYGVARLKPGILLPAAIADIRTVAAQITRDFPASNRDRGTILMPLTSAILGDIRPTFFALLGGAVLLSLIGYVNIFSLLIVRAEARKREIAVRGALGASHVRLIRQFAVEGCLLAVAGGTLGLALDLPLIHLAVGLIPRGMLSSLPCLADLHLGWHVVFVVLGATVAAAALFTLAPTAQLGFSAMRNGLSEGGRGAADRSWKRVGAGLVVIELAVTVIMLSSAGLLAKSFYRLLHGDLGLSPDHLAVLHIERTGDPSNAQQVALEQEVVNRVAQLPGVISVGTSGALAVGSDEAFKAAFAHFHVFGRVYSGPGDEALDGVAGSGYFETIHARLLRGRSFTKAIVGVIDDLKDGPLDMAPVAAIYSPFEQVPRNSFYITARTVSSPGSSLHAIEAVVRQVDPEDGLDTMEDRINDSQSAYLHRSAMSLVSCFAVLALVLGTVGLYGVVSYSVGRRTREIGLRIALGAQRASVYWLIVREASRLACMGLAGGLAGSIAAGILMRDVLYSVPPWDLETLSGVMVILVMATRLASFLPAHRAASIHPTESLRAE